MLAKGEKMMKTTDTVGPAVRSDSSSSSSASLSPTLPTPAKINVTPLIRKDSSKPCVTYLDINIIQEIAAITQTHVMPVDRRAVLTFQNYFTSSIVLQQPNKEGEFTTM